MIIITDKRSRMFFATVLIILCALCAKLLYLGIFKNNTYSKAVETQSVAKVSLGKKRGVIYDRNMIPLTERETQKIYVGSDGNISNEEGCIEITIPERYKKRYAASHIIGYCTDESGGMSGIEKKFDKILSRDDEYSLSYSADGVGRLKEGVSFSLEFKRDTKDSLMLTLDYHIQNIAEKVMDEYIEKGSVVILDVESFDILAAVSRPDYDKNRVDTYLSSDGTELLNRSLCQYNPGSVFKIVTAIAAIENNAQIKDIFYECNGSYTTEDFHTFPCHKSDGHGRENLKSAFANSCNCFFYNIGVNLGGNIICDTARKLGLGKKLLTLGDEESSGNIPEGDFFTAGESANISIGQGEIMITPLQCASLAATVASGGIIKEINIADSVVDINGNKIKDLRKYGEYEAIGNECAAALGDMMRQCVLEGTAKEAGSSQASIAGKTGSAETGWLQSDGSLSVHGWFCGFFPYESPKYAMAIISENGKSGSVSCVKPFVEICEEIDKIYPIKQ